MRLSSTVTWCAAGRFHERTFSKVCTDSVTSHDRAASLSVTPPHIPLSRAVYQALLPLDAIPEVGVVGVALLLQCFECLPRSAGPVRGGGGCRVPRRAGHSMPPAYLHICADGVWVRVRVWASVRWRTERKRLASCCLGAIRQITSASLDTPPTSTTAASLQHPRGRLSRAQRAALSKWVGLWSGAWPHGWLRGRGH